MLHKKILNPAKIPFISWFLIVGLIIPSFWSPILAETMSSASYTITADSLNIGGNLSSSASFSLQDTIGEIASGEDATSASFASCSGYQCTAVSVMKRAELLTIFLFSW